jgi:hypothetical protein
MLPVQGQDTNPILQKTEQGIQQKVPQNLQDQFQKVITAGQTIMYSGNGKLIAQQLNKPGDVLQNVGEGAAKLVGKLFQQSGHQLPVSLAAPAAIIFMCEALDYLEQSGKIQVTNDVVAKATQDTSAYVLQLFGVSQDKLHQIIANAHGEGAVPHPAGNPAANIPNPPQPSQSGILTSSMGS